MSVNGLPQLLHVLEASSGSHACGLNPPCVRAASDSVLESTDMAADAAARGRGADMAAVDMVLVCSFVQSVRIQVDINHLTAPLHFKHDQAWHCQSRE